MTLTEKAVEKLREALLQGNFPDGCSLTERQVSEYLGMSRTPVRAALQTLASEGLLAYEAQRGYSIREISPKAVFDAYLVRAALEALACREIAERGLSAQTESVLEACVTQGRDLLADGSGEFRHAEWRDMNNRFHQAIAEAADNEALTDVLLRVERLPMLSFRVIATIGARPDMALLEGAQRDHEQILASLRAGQSTRASSRMHEHILVAGDLIVSDMRGNLAREAGAARPAEADAAPTPRRHT